MEIVKESRSSSGSSRVAATDLGAGVDVFALLESSPINTMYCGTDLVIRYLNPRSVATLQSLQKYLPIPVHQFVGSKIDVFHKDPTHQQELLRNDRNLPIQSVIQLGPEKLDLLATAIYGKERTFVGIMVTWSVVTEKLKLQNEMARVTPMVENAPVNILAADLDGKIVYVNLLSVTTLRQLESILPVKVDQILGGSYDVFHKEPGRQRALLADEKNLPHRAMISLGREKLDLLVTAMRDSSGKYIGPMVTWSVVTKKVGLLDTLTTQLGGAAEELSATAKEMTKNANLTAQKSAQSSVAAEEVSKGVRVVATNTEEMAASIKEIAKSSSSAAEISVQAMKQAKDTNNTITELGAASIEIGQVIKVISSIAQQTNLLALNATIEAARAGDAGRGFAVVANEVKELAKQTAKATNEITDKIKSIQESSEGAVTAIGSISKIIEQLNGIAISIAASVEEQTATTNEVARVVQESNTAVSGIVEDFKDVSKAAEQNVLGATQTAEASQALLDLVENVKQLAKQV